jgi:hypothetical protein
LKGLKQIFVSTCNRLSFLKESLGSVLTQSVFGFEIVVASVNSGSSANLLALASLTSYILGDKQVKDVFMLTRGN